MQDIKIYNSFSGNKEVFVPINKEHVKDATKSYGVISRLYSGSFLREGEDGVDNSFIASQPSTVSGEEVKKFREDMLNLTKNFLNT